MGNAYIVKNKQDVIYNNYYKESIDNWPKSFPCIMVEKSVRNGFGGMIDHYEFFYPPKKLTINEKEIWLSAFVEGINNV
jgi:hypothetical protein